MKLFVFCLLLLVTTARLYGQGYNAALKKQLDSVWQRDQQYREILSNGIADSTQKDSLAKALHLPANSIINALWKLQNAIDSADIIFIEGVFVRYGYPGKTLVGLPTNEAAWNVVQHSVKIDKYLPLIKKEAEQKELPFKLYAMMYDRYLVEHKQEQVYGSQITMLHLKTGENDWFVWPIKNPEKVNQLRKQAGFTETVEENAKRLDVVYRVIKMGEIK